MLRFSRVCVKIFGLLVVSLLFHVRTESGFVRAEVNDSIRLKIVTFGNSITAERKGIQQVYAQRLPALLAEKGISVRVINSGVGGSHTGRFADNPTFKIKHALDRFETDVLDHNPDLVTFGFGSNDAYIDSKVKDGPSRIPLDKYEANLTYMIKTLQAKGTMIVLIVPNIMWGNSGGIQNDRLLLYRKVLKKLSRKYHTGFVDNYMGFVDYQKKTGISYETLMPDGIHPNDKGHELIAASLAKEIERIVKKTKGKHEAH